VSSDFVLALPRSAPVGVSERSGVDPLPGEVVLRHLLRPFSEFPDLIAKLDLALSEILGDSVRCGVMVWRESEGVLQMIPGSFGSTPSVAASYQVAVTNRKSNAARVFVDRRTFFSNHASGDPAILQEYVGAFGIDSLLSARLAGEEGPVGVLHVINKRSAFTAADVAKVERVSPLIAAAIARASHVIELHRKARLEEILARVAVAIVSTDSIYAPLKAALEELCIALEAAFVTFVPVEGQPQIWQQKDADEAKVASALADRRGQSRVRHVLVGPTRAGDPGSAAFHVPVRLRRQQIGQLTILRGRGQPFTPAERDAILRLADLAALAWATDLYQDQRLELARFGERQRIADDLHDDLAQLYYAVQMSLDDVRVESEDPLAVERNVDRVSGLVAKADDALRNAIFHLSPPPTGELHQQLAEVVAIIEDEFAIHARVSVTAEAAEAAATVQGTARDALVKLTRESVTNAAKHAGPCRVGVSVRVGRGRLVVTIADDGIGIDRKRPAGHGLASCRRAIKRCRGSVRVYVSESQPGTRVVASLPLPRL